MHIERLVLGDLQANCWLVDDAVGGPLLVIDPAGDEEFLLEALQDRAVAVIVLTHGHFDHLGAASRLVEATGAPIAVHEADAGRITTPEGSGAAMFGFDDFAPAADRLLRHGDIVEAGALRMDVLHTPGHTPGGISLVAIDAAGAPHVFTGDTLFSGSVGRTDFPGGDARALSRSIAEHLASLPDNTVVHPGHGPDTTIGRERAVNPFFPRA